MNVVNLQEASEWNQKSKWDGSTSRQGEKMETAWEAGVSRSFTEDGEMEGDVG